MRRASLSLSLSLTFSVVKPRNICRPVGGSISWIFFFSFFLKSTRTPMTVDSASTQSKTVLRSTRNGSLSEKHSRTWYDKLKRTRDKVDRLRASNRELVQACERRTKCVFCFYVSLEICYTLILATDIRVCVCVCVYIIFRYMCCFFFRVSSLSLFLSFSRRML